jgi:hypothetical protein
MREVLRTVLLAAAREYRLALPALGVQAALETDASALIVVFQGPMRDTELRAGATLAPASRLKHICVVLLDGSTFFYPNTEVGGLLGLPAGSRAAPP